MRCINPRFTYLLTDGRNGYANIALYAIMHSFKLGVGCAINILCDFCRLIQAVYWSRVTRNRCPPSRQYNMSSRRQFHVLSVWFQDHVVERRRLQIKWHHFTFERYWI